MGHFAKILGHFGLILGHVAKMFFGMFLGHFESKGALCKGDVPHHQPIETMRGIEKVGHLGTSFIELIKNQKKTEKHINFIGRENMAAGSAP